MCEDCGNYDACEDANSAGINNRRCCRSCYEMLPKRMRPSIFMPRAASRLTLTVTDVRVRRLQDIRDADCRAEGCSGGHDSIPGYGFSATPGEHFRWLRDSLNADRAPWASNPWICAVGLNVHKCNIDHVGAAA